MKLLVTGGAGYIGSVVAAQLLAAGHEVAVLDDLSTGHANAVPDGARFVQGEIADADLVRTVLGTDTDAVLHFAAASLVGESTVDPALYYRRNVAGTMELLDSMRSVGTPEIVFSSSAATYGEPEEIPIPETAPTRPTNPYGATKAAIDEMIGWYSGAYGLAATSLRYFNVAGSDGERGERHSPETHLIPIVLQAADDPTRSVEVFGTDYPTPDGTAIRDYVHVADLADAHVRALGGPAGVHRIYNLGSGIGYSVREVIAAFQEATGRAIRVEEGPRRTGDPARLVASNGLIAEDLGWTPVHGLDSMVQSAWNFARQSN